MGLGQAEYIEEDEQSKKEILEMMNDSPGSTKFKRVGLPILIIRLASLCAEPIVAGHLRGRAERR
jgi:hypothetical protein